MLSLMSSHTHIEFCYVLVTLIVMVTGTTLLFEVGWLIKSISGSHFTRTSKCQPTVTR